MARWLLFLPFIICLVANAATPNNALVKTTGAAFKSYQACIDLSVETYDDRISDATTIGRIAVDDCRDQYEAMLRIAYPGAESVIQEKSRDQAWQLNVAVRRVLRDRKKRH